MPRRFIRAQFKPGEGRAYTYHCDDDGLLLVTGDRVEVESRHGTATVHVCELDVEEPTDFPTKPVLGLAPEKEQTDGD